jgi:hypothetical protein
MLWVIREYGFHESLKLVACCPKNNFDYEDTVWSPSSVRVKVHVH